MAPDSPVADDVPRIRCFACAELVHPEARKCRWCHEWFEDMVSTPQRREPRTTAAEAAERYPSEPDDRGEDAPTGEGGEEITQAMLRVDAIALEIGADLTRFADPEQGDGELLDRLKHVRRRLAMEFGVIAPGVRVRPHPSLRPAEYQIRLQGDLVAEGEVAAADHGAGGVGADRLAALDVVATHVANVVRSNLAELLTREEVAELLNMARQDSPMVVQELVPNMLALGQLRQVLQNLVREHVPIKNMAVILNVLADNAVYTKDPHALTEHVRVAMGRTICERYRSPDGVLRVFRLSLDAERAIQSSIQLNETGQVLMLDPNTSRAIKDNLGEALDRFRSQVPAAVVVAPPKIRRHVRALLERDFSKIVVLSDDEIVRGVQVETLETIEVDSYAAPASATAPTPGGSDWLSA